VIEQRINELFGDAESTGLGTGWWSGVLAVFLGFLSFGAVLCLRFPQLLTVPQFRPHYPMQAIRTLIQCLIVGAAAFGILSSILRRKKVLALTGLLLAMTAAALGGSTVRINEALRDGPAIGLDWFLLDLLLTSVFFVPLERLWPLRKEQGTFRNQWTLDVVYFMSTHLPIQILSFLILLPAVHFARYLSVPGLQTLVARLPWLLQFFMAVLVADVAEYFIHLAFHKVPLLWRFHAVHHSSTALDWLSGSRGHFFEDIIVRACIITPLMIAFSQSVILGYLIFVTLQATWSHCNFAPGPRWLAKCLVTPKYHHWHHTSQKEGLDKNFAVHFPWIDRVFGTYYLPDEWPELYGLDGEQISPGFIRQTIEPFTKRKRS
jgi:sterol desaturase/sphingolipid hydroxylase (fatty acid hydroxylase superfamily)